MALKDETAQLIAKMNKQLEKDGKPLLTTASELGVPKKFTSGILSLDVALGGGWPGNQWVEIYGKESNGKTSGILHTISANQKLDPDFSTFWVASEHYDMEWAAQNGVDNSRVLVYPTSNMELAYQMIMDMAFSRKFDCIVLDSYPALSASEEEEKGMDQNTMTLGARRTGQFFRKVGGTFSAERPYIGFFVNQLRDAVGSFSPYGTPTTTPGGKAKNYAFYQRVLVSRDDWIEESVEGMKGKTKVGQTIKFKTEKNKAAPPQQVATTDFYFAESNKGFMPGEHDEIKDMIAMAVMFRVIVRGGAWYNFGEHKWMGGQAMIDGIREDLDMQDEIRRMVLDKVSPQKDEKLDLE